MSYGHVAVGALGCPGPCRCGGRAAAGLGELCPSCYFPVGDQCVACPEGSTLPECVGCRGGVLDTGAPAWYERPVAGPVIVGLVSAVTLGIAIPLLRRQLGRRGIVLE